MHFHQVNKGPVMYLESTQSSAPMILFIYLFIIFFHPHTKPFKTMPGAEGEKSL